jgi:hypothetical protein
LVFYRNFRGLVSVVAASCKCTLHVPVCILV